MTMETLSEFWVRTNAFIWDSFPRDDGLVTNPNLSRKVRPDGGFAPFFGNTVVFPLPEEVRRRLGVLRDALHASCGSILAEPLATDSFHITLHDLLSGPPSAALGEQVAITRKQALDCVGHIGEQGGAVRLHSTALFQMVNTSLVLGFAPADEASCQRLMTGYARLQEVVPLSYPLTPHVTLAYFRPGRVEPEQVERLRGIAERVRQQPQLEVVLPLRALEYQLFFDMNHYRMGAE